ncbi:MAG: Asp-tRNA(Asn)/Glu-tRNA(Gln) amidotransferase subunit GatC [Ignavibacteriae bacterium]|nr:Asp-tRNA(Asn)/Glu-tRNA(Gln) amidotransferase subunit GatC [Ignavibacteriota bacterium]
MSVTVKEVEYIASLARLSFSEEEKEKLTHQLNDILNYMEQLNTLDTSDVEPLAQVIESNNVLREDTVRSGLTREDALRNAPARTEKFFKVPKVIGER